MSKRSTLGKLALLFSLPLLLMMSSFATPGLTPAAAAPARLDCSKATDQQIVDEVIKNIKQAFTTEEITNLLHFNITCKNRVVKLRGFALSNTKNKPNATRNRVIDIVRKTDCVKSVDASRLGVINKAGCGPNEKPCNGGCIPKADPCNPITE